LLEALEARDGELAHAWMTRHIRDFSRGYELAGIKLEMRVTSRPTALKTRARA
jgi:hypothetical protein